MSHTPGPWTVHKQMVGPEVAGCMVIMPPNGGPPVAYAADRVNARLIAAAPDLLAALKGFVNLTNDDLDDEQCAAWDAAVDAIAKAEGK